jgi:voltage-gated potassium channel
MPTARSRAYRYLEPNEHQKAWEKLPDALIVGLIVLSAVIVLLDSLPAMAPFAALLYTLEAVCVAVFTVEYGLRVWTCVESPEFAHPVWGRVRYVLSPLALIDLLAIVPFYIAPLAAHDTVVFRLLRIFRLLRLLKLGRYHRSLGLLGKVLKNRREELAISLVLVVILVVVASTLMYALEHEAQPKAFASIPAAMWWGVVTMTTVGYGDVYPVTPAGKVVAGVSLLLGIGLFALPAGILASGFSEELQREREEGQTQPVCPHCGKPLDEH